MLIVRVELHSAITGKVTEIARCDIWNEGSGNRHHGNYSCASFRGRTHEDLSKRKMQRKGEVRNHPRLREHVFCLVNKALTSMGYSGIVEDDWPTEPAR